MSRQSILHRAPARAIFQTTFWALAILVMTSIHHVYGAALFSTPWRLHIVYVSIPAALIILAAIPAGRAAPHGLVSRAASWLYVAIIGVFAVGMIGFYEGGYNHLIPNIQYALGVEHPLREGLYEPPDDLIFQLIGVAQFPIAVLAGWRLFQLVVTQGSRAASPGA